MPKIKEDWSTRTIKTPDGITITFFDNKLHNWNGPALKYPSSYKQKAEYYWQHIRFYLMCMCEINFYQILDHIYNKNN